MAKRSIKPGLQHKESSYRQTTAAVKFIAAHRQLLKFLRYAILCCEEEFRRSRPHAGLLATKIEESNYRLRCTTFDVGIVDENTVSRENQLQRSHQCAYGTDGDDLG